MRRTEMPSDDDATHGVMVLTALQALQLMQQLRDVLLDIAATPWSGVQIRVAYTSADTDDATITDVVAEALPGFWKESH
jgi:hypothetical protein